MKKTLLAAALLAATSYATAATDVTLYGVLDAGVTVSKVHGGDTKVQMLSLIHISEPTRRS